jgi:hypothetical protein
VGGLASFAIIVLVICAYAFSSGYVAQYPAEKVGPSKFACDTSIRNAKYETGLQSLSLSVPEEEKPIFDLLDQQQFTLQLDLLSTVASCRTFTAWQILGASTKSLPLVSCFDSDGILSANISLPYQGVTIQFILLDIQVVGAVRVGLEGQERENGAYALGKLDFRQTFYVDSDRTLGQAATVNLQLTKVYRLGCEYFFFHYFLSKAINETDSISSSGSVFSGLWYPTFTVDKNQMFISDETYRTSTQESHTTLTIIISETSFFIKNRQSPIAKQPEVVFHNLLFTIVCLEIFGLIFLFFKLALFPIGHAFIKHCHRNHRIQLMMNIRNNDEKKQVHDVAIELGQ